MNLCSATDFKGGLVVDARGVAQSKRGEWDRGQNPLEHRARGIDENAKEHSQPRPQLPSFARIASCGVAVRYGPCYWGHNDKDNLNIWKAQALAVLPGQMAEVEQVRLSENRAPQF